MMHHTLLVLQVLVGGLLIQQLQCCTQHPVEKNVLAFNLTVFLVVFFTHLHRSDHMPRVWHYAHVLLALQIVAGPVVFYQTPFLKKLYLGTAALIWTLMLVRGKCIVEDAIEEFDHTAPSNLGFKTWHVLVGVPLLMYLTLKRR